MAAASAPSGPRGPKQVRPRPQGGSAPASGQEWTMRSPGGPEGFGMA